MKTWKNLFPEIVSLGNLYAAAAKARKRKTRKGYVENFGLRREREIRRMQEALMAESWRPSRYRQFQIHDPRTRLISAAPFADRVVHHALCAVIEPILQRRFVYDSYSCQKGKGTERARERCRGYTNRFRYVLKGDIRKFFQSIDHTLLLEKLARIIRCPRTLRLCAWIIESCEDHEIEPVPFAGDDLFTPYARKRGLPIGNLTSQLWANFYLDAMDHYIKEDLRARAYARYTDDFLIWSDDKASLHRFREAISAFLGGERLVLQPRKTRIFPVGQGVPFLGFRFYPGRAPRVLAESRRRFEKRSRRQAAAIRKGEWSREKANESARGWMAFARYGNVEGLLNGHREQPFG